MSKSSRPAALLLYMLVLSPILSTLAQEKPLTRTFVAGTEERYQVAVTIRVETHGISTEKIGEKTCATPFTHQADGQISWRSVRQISSLKQDGSAAIAETLDRFQATCDGNADSKTFDAVLQKSVQGACISWQNFSQMSYEEEKLGLIRGLPEPAGQLIGADSTLLPLWIRRAFRPSAILPRAPIKFGARTARNVANPSAGERSPQGQESTEWLEVASDLPAATLHTSQDLRWTDPPRKSRSNDANGAPAMRQFFYADSLNTISLLDGSLLKASRSATRETKEILDAVPGLPDAPEFGSKLTITVTILRLP